MYYLLLLFAVIVSFSKTIGLDNIGCWEKWVLLGIAALVLAFGTGYLCYLTGKMVCYRRRLEDARSHLSPDFETFENSWLKVGCDFWGKRKKDKKRGEICYSWRKTSLELSLFLIIMLLIGFGFVVWYLFWMPDC